MVRLPSSVLVRVFLLVVFLGCCFGFGLGSGTTARAQTSGPTVGSWAWMGGNSGYNAYDGNWAAPYVFDPANFPGVRSSAATAIDKSGRLWLYGGLTTQADPTNSQGLLHSDLDDLWVFDPAQGEHGEWAWIAGGHSPTPCVPISPNPTCTSVIPEVQGTKYVFAPENTPGGREVSSAWMDSQGRFWMFGGRVTGANAVAYVNELWVFDPAQGAHGEWAWMGGDNGNGCNSSPGVNCSSQGSKGTEYQFASSNIPGGTSGAPVWTGLDGKVWILWQEMASTYINELWAFDPSQGEHGEWAWMGSCGDCSPPRQYPYFNVPEYQFQDAYAPLGRITTGAWTDKNGRFWLLGGTQVPFPAQGPVMLNDLWSFDSTLGAHGQWAWMGGSNTIRNPDSCHGFNCAQPGVYGMESISDPANSPGGRESLSTAVDPQGNLWLFGGRGADAAGNWGYLDDLWSFNPTLGAHGEWTWVGGGSTVPMDCPDPAGLSCPIPSVYGTKYEFSPANHPGGRTGAVTWFDTNGNLWLFGGMGWSNAVGVPQPVSLDDLWEFKLQSGSDAFAPLFDAPPGGYYAGQSVTIYDVLPDTTIYYTTDGSTPTPQSTLYTGPVQITTDETISAIAVSTHYGQSSVSTAAYTIIPGTAPAIVWPAPAPIIYPNPLGPQLNATIAAAGSFTYDPPAGTVLTAGTHTLTATFVPTPGQGIGTQTATVTLVVMQYTPRVAWNSPADIIYGTALSATQLNATADVPGTFAYSPASGTVLPAGSQTLSATFHPDDTVDYTSPVTTVPLNVQRADPTIIITSSENPAVVGDPITFTAKLTASQGVPTGSIAFYDGTNQLGAATVTSGAAAYTPPSAFTVGSHAITAIYSGDGNFTSATSSPLTQTINPFTVGPPSGGSTSATVSPGGTATYLLSVTPPATTAVSFSISGVPTGASASFNPTTVAAGAGPTSVQLKIIVPSQSAMIPARSGSAPLTLAVFLLPLLGLGAVRRKVIPRLLLAVVALSSLAWLSGCGGSSQSTPPPSPQTYTLTVTATAGTLSGQTNLTLTVQ